MAYDVHQVTKVKTIDKKALRNVILHTEISNRGKEEREMWRKLNNIKNNDDDDKSVKKLKRKHERDYKNEKPKRLKAEKEKKIESKSVIKWGHDGFNELYKDVSDDSNSERDENRKIKKHKSKKKKKHKKKSKKRKKYEIESD